ncbi:hypothetical protein [Saccharopolyspora sp. 6M]|uniref:hypothetical protein n=1 Tax=Saccharopolyspora sp. 6M TaxID=2877237 RepID=UPI001CD317C8|nr:hypothetical protein [Saccharopolyspora sp. 6M]MCA1225910.1 hypothetical protein [Saccharopolyspora sp. 6M]
MSILVGGGAGALTAALVVKVKLGEHAPQPGPPQASPPFAQLFPHAQPQPLPQGPHSQVPQSQASPSQPFPAAQPQQFGQPFPQSQPFPQQAPPQPYPPQGPYPPR